MTEEGNDRLTHKNLIWHPGDGPISHAQLSAMHTRHANAIRPIPSSTALGYEHLMADADRGSLLAELNREIERADRRERELLSELEKTPDHAACQPEAWDAAARVARELREEVERLRAIIARVSALHAPIEVPGVGQCCKANHGVAWKRWPCQESTILADEDERCGGEYCVGWKDSGTCPQGVWHR